MKEMKEFILKIESSWNILEASSHMIVKSLWGDRRVPRLSGQCWKWLEFSGTIITISSLPSSNGLQAFK